MTQTHYSTNMEKKTLERYHWNNEGSSAILNNGYVLPGTTVQDLVHRIADAAATRHKDKFDYDDVYTGIKDAIEYGFLSLSSPIWANFGVPTETRKGLPISCFGTRVEDSVPGIVQAWAESSMEGSLGGGTSTYWGDVRARGSEINGGSKSDGSFSFLPMFEGMVKTISQGGVRRGQMAVYQDVEHPDIKEWLGIYKEGNPIQTMVYGVCIGDEWMESMLGDKENGIPGDPEKREIWAEILGRREKIGLPFLFWRDNADAGRPEVYKVKEKHIQASNMCTEIMLPYEEDESFICCLASYNFTLYEYWKDTDLYLYSLLLLDAVLEEFIEKTEHIPHMHKTRNFAINHRSVGIGILGWHSYLQSKNIVFSDLEAILLAADSTRDIKQKLVKASADMIDAGYERPKIFEGTDIKQRHATLMAIAPTKSSSGILGQVSLGIEPYETNYFVKDLAKVKMTYRNPYLTKLLQSKGLDTDEIWMSILNNRGSVQHLTQLSAHEKKVFRTFEEIPQMSILQQASARQSSVCQGQSVNVKILPNTSPKEVSNFYIEAWRMKLKSMYYQYNVNAAQALSNTLNSCDACEV